MNQTAFFEGKQYFLGIAFEPILILGMDVIGSLDVLIIDYKLRELQLRAKH